MARKFLYAIAILIVLFLVSLVALRMWSNELTEAAFVPSERFVEQQALEANAYEDPLMWFSHPRYRAEDDPSRWRPIQDASPIGEPPVPAPSASAASEEDEAAESPVTDTPAFAVFFVHPTSYLDRTHWNAPLGDEASQQRARLFLRGMASPFAAAREIWAPRYRQATFGAFLTDDAEAGLALDAAYRDVEQAFDVFLENVDPQLPIVLAGHSQGAMHVLRLLQERVAGTDLEQRIAMVYPVGWPISVEHDLPALPFPGCTGPSQAGCIVTWSSFAEPADPGIMLRRFSSTPGLDGKPRGEGPILCVNPLTGGIGGEAPASANLGTLLPNAELTSGALIAGSVPARCAKNGLLSIGDPPELGPYVLPGNNYHVYDIPLFWKNLQQDVARRVQAWSAARQ